MGTRVRRWTGWNGRRGAWAGRSPDSSRAWRKTSTSSVGWPAAAGPRRQAIESPWAGGLLDPRLRPLPAGDPRLRHRPVVPRISLPASAARDALGREFPVVRSRDVGLV